MYNVLFVFAMQMILIFLIAYEFIIEEFSMLKVHIQVALARLICAYLLHFAMEAETRQSLKLFKYWCDHSNNLPLKAPDIKAPLEPEYEKE